MSARRSLIPHWRRIRRLRRRLSCLFRLPIGRHSARIGRKGEKLARRYLRRNLYSITAVNWRRPCGELDVVARDGRTLVFVEVKTRQARFGGGFSALAAVDAEKRRQLRRTARAFLRSHRPLLTRRRIRQLRFDVLTVTYTPRRWPLPPRFSIRHYPGKREPIGPEFVS